MQNAIKTVVAPQQASRVLFSCMESGASFARIGSATKAFHEGENTMLSDEANGGVGPAARGGGNIKNTTTFENQCSSS